MNDPGDPSTDEDLDVLRYVRATILVIDKLGVILQAHGGAGLPLNYPAEDLVGHNALEFIAEEDHLTMAELFLGSADLPIVATPQPFPVNIVGADAITRVWDCVPSGFSHGETDGWVVTMTCRQEQAVSIVAMEHFLRGDSALEIAAVLAARSNNSSEDGWKKRTFVVHRTTPTPLAPTAAWHLLPNGVAETTDLTEAIEACLDDPISPWFRLPPGTTEPNSTLPAALQAAADATGLSYCSTLTVGLDGETEMAFLRFSNYPRELQGNNLLADQSVDAVLQQALGAERARRLLDTAMRIDPLTGIANRFHFDEIVAADDRAAHAALFVDIDNFKSVNDNYGHDAGDAALREVAARIVRSCRPRDLVARVGGDEFAVILRDVTKAEAELIADRIRGLMAEPFALAEGPETISVTVGVASPTPDASLSELVRRADHAMLDEKHAARDLIE